MGYKPPKVSNYPDYERGYHVQCPAGYDRKLPTKGGEIVVKKDDPIVSRGLCASHHYGQTCNLCPNGEFKMVVKNIGSADDYVWLDEVLELVCKALDAKITKRKRSFGDCCIDHRNVVLIEVFFELDSGVMEQKSARLVYDMIMKASRGGNARHNVEHVKLRRHPEPSFDITVALREY